MATLEQLTELGQSIWIDSVRRACLSSGDLEGWIGEGVRGVVFDPAHFKSAVAGGTDYDDALRRLAEAGKSAGEIYEALVLHDVRTAADLLRPVYERTRGLDGYVSVGLRPSTTRDPRRTAAEARRWTADLDRPNVMIEVPAKPEGIPAVATLLGEGISVNATAIFSVAQYEAVAQAYIAGLETRAEAGRSLGGVSSVASLLIAPVDTAVDWALEDLGKGESLKGRIAIANAEVVYARFREIFGGRRWEGLVARGARVQRLLWTSTATENPLYPDTLYVDGLVGPDTVCALSPSTLVALRDHGAVGPTLTEDPEGAHGHLGELGRLGVDLDEITERVQRERVAAVAGMFETVMAAIAQKLERLRVGRVPRSADLGPLRRAMEAALAEMSRDKVIPRIWAHDHTVWKPEPAEISNRLGWLHAPQRMPANVPRLEAFARSVRAGTGADPPYTHALLLGMGGSSLAPELFAKTLAPGGTDLEGRRFLELAVLDSTDPGAVLAEAERLDPARTLYLVSTKSGGTVETLSLFKFFYTRVAEALGTENAGRRFVAITDPGSSLADLAVRHGFRSTFLNDPTIGGRYSALSYFGLVPAALAGVDLGRLLERALEAAAACAPCVAGRDNGALWLGAHLGELARKGRDKATFVISSGVAAFGGWVEQLVAESTGKESTGILPVVGEPLGDPAVYGEDRFFVHLRLDGDAAHDDALSALAAAGHPVLRIPLADPYDLGAQFVLWEMAVAVAGSRLGIHPFDQPNVEAAKALARRMVTEYRDKGALPGGGSAPLTADALGTFLGRARPGDYVAVQAYVRPTPATDAALQSFRTRLRDRLRLATTTGYGPRYLHSTGQMHKGDGGRGLFIQLTADAADDLPIPEEAGSSVSFITFGVLKAAQALGDRRALAEGDRRVIRFHLGADVVGGLKRLEGNLP